MKPANTDSQQTTTPSVAAKLIAPTHSGCDARPPFAASASCRARRRRSNTDATSPLISSASRACSDTVVGRLEPMVRMMCSTRPVSSATPPSSQGWRRNRCAARSDSGSSRHEARLADSSALPRPAISAATITTRIDDVASASRSPSRVPFQLMPRCTSFAASAITSVLERAIAAAIALRRRRPSGSLRMATCSHTRCNVQRPPTSNATAANRHSNSGVRFGGCLASRQASPRLAAKWRKRVMSPGKACAWLAQKAWPNGVLVRSASRAWNWSLRSPVICPTSCWASSPSDFACTICALRPACALSSCRRCAATSGASGGAPLAGAGPSTVICACSAVICGARPAANWFA